MRFKRRGWEEYTGVSYILFSLDLYTCKKQQQQKKNKKQKEYGILNDEHDSNIQYKTPQAKKL